MSCSLPLDMSLLLLMLSFPYCSSYFIRDFYTGQILPDVDYTVNQVSVLNSGTNEPRVSQLVWQR